MLVFKNKITDHRTSMHVPHLFHDCCSTKNSSFLCALWATLLVHFFYFGDGDIGCYYSVYNATLIQSSRETMINTFHRFFLHSYLLCWTNIRNSIHFTTLCKHCTPPKCLCPSIIPIDQITQRKSKSKIRENDNFVFVVQNCFQCLFFFLNIFFF